ALSSRLGIMAEGQLLTVGTAQQIKEKHGSSQELVLRLRPESEEALSQVMRDMSSELEASSVMAMLESTPWRRAAYYRPRCIVRLQLEQRGCVEASVLAEWWLQQAKGHAIEEFLQSLAGDRVELAEDFGLYWRFRLPRSGLSLPQLFQQLEENSARLGMDEYTVSQATLEQIFNSITE
ncbi:ABCA1, partial [Symbiodinium sp. CCMP2592]